MDSSLSGELWEERKGEKRRGVEYKREMRGEERG
jgi:hypothetical protein